jgi:hypothetical protein
MIGLLIRWGSTLIFPTVSSEPIFIGPGKGANAPCGNSLDPQIFDRLRFSALASQAPFIRRLPIYAGVGRTSVRKANVCQLPDPRNSQSRRPAASHQVAYLFQLTTNPFFGIGARASSRSATHISPEYKPSLIPRMQLKGQE